MTSKHSPPEFLQDTIRKTLNKEVAEWFRDVTDLDDISTARGALRRCCTHVENDTNDMTIMRTLLFYMVCGAMGEPKAWLAPERQVMNVEGNPQVILLFVETLQSMRRRRAKKRHHMRCSFRLMKENFADASDRTKIEQLERKVRLQFPTNYRHQVGQTNYTYVDKPNGYQLRISAFNEASARELARKLLECNLDASLSFEERNWSQASTKSRSPGQLKRVLGKQIRTNERRPSAIMALRQADLFIPGYGSEILVSRGLV